MSTFEQRRRSFLATMGALGVTGLLSKSMMEAESAVGKGYLLADAGGETLIHFRDGGRVSIKVGSATGSANIAMGTQQVMPGSGIPIHRHFQTDETFYILGGSGTVILNDVRHSFEKNGTIFIPKNTWHGFENPDRELLLLWVVSPPGLDGFFRAACSAPGVPPKDLTRQQIHEIALKYDTEFR